MHFLAAAATYMNGAEQHVTLKHAFQPSSTLQLHH
jgi:hypothetical protein